MTTEVAPKRTWQGIRAFAWPVWPWMNWLLPLYFCFHGWLHGVGGWETLILSVGSIVIVPVGALLGSLPRFILRRRGFELPPAAMVPVLFVNWWSWFLAALLMPGTGDSAASLDSAFEAIVGRRVPGGEIVVVLGFFLGIITWVGLVVYAAAAVPPRENPSDRAWNITSLITAVAIPVLIVAMTVGSFVFTDERPDAGGRTARDVATMTQREQVEFAEGNWNAMQSSLSEVRALVSADGWDHRGRGMEPNPRPCKNATPDCYGLVTSFVYGAEREIDVTAILDELAERGWKVDVKRQEARSPEGQRVEIDGDGVAYTFVTVAAEASFWWGDWYQLYGASSVQEPKESYAADEWPRLR